MKKTDDEPEMVSRLLPPQRPPTATMPSLLTQPALGSSLSFPNHRTVTHVEVGITLPSWGGDRRSGEEGDGEVRPSPEGLLSPGCWGQRCFNNSL